MSDAPTPAAPSSPAAAVAEPAQEPPSPSPGHEKRLWPLALGALGIVYGDIGTSPLYAVAECFAKKPNAQGELETVHHALPVTEASVLGLLSLFFW